MILLANCAVFLAYAYIAFGMARAFGASSSAALWIGGAITLARMVMNLPEHDIPLETRGNIVLASVVVFAVLIVHGLLASRPRKSTAIVPAPIDLNEVR